MHSLLAFTRVSASSPTTKLFLFCGDLIWDRQRLQTEALRRIREYAWRTCGENKQVRQAGSYSESTCNLGLPMTTSHSKPYAALIGLLQPLRLSKDPHDAGSEDYPSRKVCNVCHDYARSEIPGQHCRILICNAVTALRPISA